MNIKNIRKIFIIVSIISAMLSSCVFDLMPLGYSIVNCTNDTLLIDIMQSDTLDDEMYYNDKQWHDTIGRIFPEDTIMFYRHREKVVVWRGYYAQPDSTVFFGPELFNLKDTCYIYAIKWNVAKYYTLDEIRARKLYYKQAVTKWDFHNRLFEYRYPDSEKDN